MDKEQFWKIVDASAAQAGDDQEAQAEYLRDELGKLTPEEIVAFGRELDLRLAESYAWRLWGAAYLLNGGCSDDGFDYFRGWLVAKGRAIYEEALANPDSLAAHTDAESDYHEFEDMLYLPRMVYEEITGDDGGYDTGVRFGEVQGEEWDFDDEAEMAARYPAIFRLKAG